MITEMLDARRKTMQLLVDIEGDSSIEVQAIDSADNLVAS